MSKSKIPYRIEYKMTLKRAKEIALSRMGRKLKPGYECTVAILRENHSTQYPHSCYQLNLVNSADHYYLYEWFNPNCHHLGYDLSHVIELENVKDTRSI